QTGSAHKTRAGVVMGTASYLPPELFLESRGNQLQDAPVADVYALGQTACELLAGRPVHKREDVDGPHMIVQIMKDKVTRTALDPREWNPGVPAALAEIVRSATAQEPEERIPTAGELERRLRAWLASRDAPTPAPVSKASAALPAPPSPAPTLPTGPTPTTEPLVPRMAVGLGAVGLLGLSAAGLVTLTLLGLVGLWLARPDPAQAAARRALEARLHADAPALRACVQERRAVALDVDLRGGRVASVGVQGLPEPAKACVAARIGGWTVQAPDARASLQVTLVP
ncbi:MAG: hypothetical protein KC656_23670, partial [Myxococcales bacterium]|nr:hypothetical protein [Myxococcales bacterium]